MNKLPQGKDIYEQIQKVESSDFAALAKIRETQDTYMHAFLERLDTYLEKESLIHDPETQYETLLDFHRVCALMIGLNKAVLTRETFLYFKNMEGQTDAAGKKLAESAKKEYAVGMCAKSLAVKDILENYEINLKTRLYGLSKSTGR